MATYLDHAATTPPRPEARAALDQWLDAANASAVHVAGQTARTGVEESREAIAGELGVSPHEVVFTSGGTEADNLAVKGIAWAARETARGVPHLVVSAVEHAAVGQAARWLAERGDVRLTVIGVGSDGRVHVEEVLEAVTDDTVLVSVMAANNEIGAVNDVAAIGAALEHRRAVFHTDAVQLFATRQVDPTGWGADALALSAHKFGGPQGVGVAVLRRGVPVVPLLHGGGQDRGVRSGTFAVGLDAACGAAVVAAAADREALAARLGRLSARLSEGLSAIDGVRRTGPEDPAHRLASHVHVLIDRVAAPALTVALDRADIAASPGSACSAGATTGSHVVAAIGGTGVPLRLTLGWTSTVDDVDRVVDVLADTVPRLQTAGGAGAALGLTPGPAAGSAG